MEKDQKEKWIDDVMSSWEGSERATPSNDLFGKIEQEIDANEVKVVPMQQWRMVAVAASLLVLLNVFALRQVASGYASAESEFGMEGTANEQLISDFKIYD